MATWKVSSVGLHSQTDTVYGYGAFIYSDIAALRHFLIKLILERKIITAFGILYANASCSLVYSVPNNMSIQTAVHHHAALHVHFIAYFQQAEIGTGPESLFIAVTV